MKKVILIDGNNLLFKSYYATAYTGNMMKNSKGFPTNALFGFVNMLNKIINEENPKYIVVALDKGKTFRHNKFENYKANRIEMPDELRIQFDKAKEIMNNMGILYIEKEGYEADDIIGTFSDMVENNDEYNALIVSSDKDLLQLISDQVEMKLLKTKDHVYMNKYNFIKEYGIEPIKIIDLKGLQGDSSDNIPGVKGVGEKTALKLLCKYKSVENIYKSIDEINERLKEKLLKDKDKAFMSKELATIYKKVPLNMNLDDIVYKTPFKEKLIKMFEDLEFYSLLKNIKKEEKTIKDVKILNDIKDIKIEGEIGIYLEVLGENYHTGKVLGMGIYNDNNSFYIPIDVLKKNPSFLKDNPKYTYDLKKMIVALKYENIDIKNIKFDTMLAAYLLNYNIKDDIAYIAKQLGYDIPFNEKILKNKELDSKLIANMAVSKAKFIFETFIKFNEELNKEKTFSLFNDIEMPLSFVLADMEYTGIKVDANVLKEMGEEIEIKLELLTTEIYNYAGIQFNINSPKQLGEVLFDKLKIPYKRNKNKNYSTSKDILIKLKDSYPIINKILEYKKLTKLNSNYIKGLIEYIQSDSKIHTIFNQTLTRTGRLSSMEPNLQNIPIRYELGHLIRKAFLPDDNAKLMSSDYSQIELRIFAHMSKVEELIKAFKEDKDIHIKTAMDIFKVSEVEVNSEMRRQAKAVNFGILYGISSFGLSEDLDINVNEAKKFINQYLDTYPGVKRYMDNLINKAYEKGYVTTLMNRKRTIDELKNKNYIIRQQGERMALNTPIQGSSADIIKKAMIDIYNCFNKLNLKSKILLQVHDELIFNVYKEEKNIVAKKVKEIMENIYNLEVPLKVDIMFGDNWYQTK